MPPYSDYQINDNPNYARGHGNLFLMYMGRCVGGADKDPSTGKWVVSVDGTYDAETGSDSVIVGECDTQAAARKMLWDARHNAEI